MEIGNIVIYKGRRYVLRGFTRLSSLQTHAVLEDVETGEWTTVPLDEVEAAQAVAASHVWLAALSGW